MNYVIWKGIKSTDIKGLIISELPPITKPKMRVQETTIDGVDGSLIEELGYESYDKQIKIGLTKGFDIDEVIKYFSGEGDIVFSNEPNKYYKAKIIDQIDYTRLLRFKEAIVTFRVQPFKYEYQEEKQIIATGSVEGTEIKITDAKATEIKIDGRSTQETRSGKNLLNNIAISQTINGISFIVNEDKTITANGTATDTAVLQVSENIVLEGNYRLSGCPIGGSTSTYEIQFYGSGSAVDFGENNAISTNPNGVVRIVIRNGVKVNDLVFKPQLEKGEEKTEYEQYGATPSPDYPSEIESVGYTNLFNKETTTTGYLNSNGEYITGGQLKVSDYIKVIAGEKYTYKGTEIESTWASKICFYNNDKEFIGYSNIVKGGTTIEVPNGAFYLRTVVESTKLDEYQIEKGLISHSYIPYGKYGIEVESSSKNLYNATLEKVVVNELTRYADTKQIYLDGTPTAENRYLLGGTLLPTGTYTLCMELEKGSMSDIGFYLYKNGSWTTITNLQLKSSDGYKNHIKFTLEEPTTIYLGAYMANYQNCKNAYINYQVVKGENADYEFQPHQKSTSLLLLNEPLRSLPNGVKDIAYIKNNKLYVDRYVGSVILDGSEGWKNNGDASNVNGYYEFNSIINNMPTKQINLLCDKFQVGTEYNNSKEQVRNRQDDKIYINILVSRLDGIEVENFKTWLSTHNVQVDYELATPTTEEIGDITILELADVENTISNSADTNMVIDYVDNKLIINNLGNYISKPIFEIEGAGTIKFILNDNSVFTYNFDEDGRVVIDSEKEDAYLGTVLKNRNMNGEFPKLEIGENKITWDGLVKNINVSKKSRWL